MVVDLCVVLAVCFLATFFLAVVFLAAVRLFVEDFRVCVVFLACAITPASAWLKGRMHIKAAKRPIKYFFIFVAFILLGKSLVY